MNTAGPDHAALVGAVVAAWPEHEAALERAMPTEVRERQTVEQVSGAVRRLTGRELDRYVEGYRWMCSMVLEEELEFRRNGRYRYSTFAEVEHRVYADPSVMSRYMDGLLLSQVLWANHMAILDFYVNDFWGAAAESRAHLEVGPGHGLLLWLASSRMAGTLAGWDISETSLGRTAHALEKLGAPDGITLTSRNVFSDDTPERFDSVVLSEVLEHLEEPGLALERLRDCMRPGGRIFVNAPINSPAIDHITLFRTPEELVDLVASKGFEVEKTRFAAATGHTLERARKRALSISCAIVARRVG